MSRNSAKEAVLPNAEKQRHLDGLRNNADTWAPTLFPFQHKYPGRSKEARRDYQRSVKCNLDAAAQAATPVTSHNGEIETRNFVFEEWSVQYEKLCNIDIENKQAFKKTKFLTEFHQRLTSWYKNNPSPCIEALQLELAKRYVDMKLGHLDSKGRFKEPGKHMQRCYDALWAMPGGEQDWNRLKDEQIALLRDCDPEKQRRRKMLEDILDRWSNWKGLAKDFLHNNQRNAYASTTDGIYREPSKESMYVLVDRNDRLILVLDPKGIDNAYGPSILKKIEEDTDSYSSIKQPADTPSKQRHRNEEQPFLMNPHLTKSECGTDHYGGWHASARPVGPMYETPDSRGLEPEDKEILLQYLEGAHGLINRLVDFWFGVFDPELQQRYRDVYKGVPGHARLPQTCAEEDETFTLKVLIRNRQTYEHADSGDWSGGLTGLAQIGTFVGAAMCFNQLRLKLNGYRAGAVMVFRGQLLKHFVSPWQGRRTAFDFTTKESVRKMVEQKNCQLKTTDQYTAILESSEQKDCNDTIEDTFSADLEGTKETVTCSRKIQAGKRKRPQTDNVETSPRPEKLPKS